MTIDIWYNIGKSIELTAADAHQPTTLCLHTFLGPRYGQTITDAIVQDTALAFVTPSKESIAKTEITTNTSGLVSGAIILLFRRQLYCLQGTLNLYKLGANLYKLGSNLYKLWSKLLFRDPNLLSPGTHKMLHGPSFATVCR